MDSEKEEGQCHSGAVDSEKRKHPRFSVDFPVEYYKIGSIIKHDGKAMNASQGGLLLHLSESLPIGVYLRLNLLLFSGSRSRSVETISAVTWTDFHSDEGWKGFRTGVRFCSTLPEDMKNFLFGLSH